jgi:hypothetical protein
MRSKRQANMKKLSLVVCIIFLTTGSVFAKVPDNWWKSFPGAFKKGDVVMNAAFGLGWGLGATVAVDIPLPIADMPFSVGGSFSYTYDRSINTSTVRSSQSVFGPGFRFGWHPNLGVERLDAYALIGFMVPFYVKTVKYYDGNGKQTGKWTSRDMYWGGFFGGAVGARYYLFEKLAIFAELGYLSINYLTVGVTFKF